MEDSIPYRMYLGSHLRNFPENSHLGIKTRSIQFYKFGSNRSKISGKMHEEQLSFRQFVGFYWTYLLKKIMSWSLGT